jgi:transcription elongation factor Elf1
VKLPFPHQSACGEKLVEMPLTCNKKKKFITIIENKNQFVNGACGVCGFS